MDKYIDDFKYICNEFSLLMIKPKWYKIEVLEIDEMDFDFMARGIPSAINDANIANLLEVECNNIDVSLDFYESILLVQPVKNDFEDFTLRFFSIMIKP